MREPLTLNAYQHAANRTAANGEKNWRIRLATWALGLAGEAGEVADHVKKVLGHGHELDREYLLDECGDQLWYVAKMADELGATLEEIAQRNIDKLQRRYPNGFSSERSINRGAP